MNPPPDSPTPRLRPPGPPELRPPPIPAPGSFTPVVRPVSLPTDTAPAGALFTTPTPAPLPGRRDPLFFFINLVAAIVAATFATLLVLNF